MRVKTPDLEEKRDVTLSNHCAAAEVLLQTLQVNIKAGGKTRQVRALIDSRSQRSYLLKKIAHEMNLKPIEMKNIIHSEFGGIWEKELKGKNITLTDHGRGCPDIELLIGADFCGHLFSGNIWTLECGLVAYETKLGWLIMGKVPGLKQEDTSAHLVTSLLIKNSSVADLWKMLTLGIMDPVETKSKEEMEKNAVERRGNIL
ncbi:uncharacterized protein LOC103521977 [Trichonephila inaurata madagascariensis]|uniref:Uncharacterized protein LOC103521977 n=1 Tax=Trichonephila inaurata madagascariensis TaxID=2747483 RepID=A0A8X6XRT5_9ARAC|nr:uncharacterized protein LOC103521977 [Trichonephila inaurata madagascariensis]